MTQHLFQGTSYVIETPELNNTKLTILFFSLTRVFIITGQHNHHILQYTLYPSKSLILSYATENTQELVSLHSLYLQILINKGMLDPISTIPTVHYTILSTKNGVLESPFFIQSANHIFQVTLKQEPYHTFVKVGGKTFEGCIELFLKQDDVSTIAQLYSEPECGYDSFLQGSGETVDMIKSALQLCQMLFSVHTFQFTDNSNIDCGKKNMSKPPPRKQQKPLSLAHLYLMTHCKTWYEYHFNAFLTEPEQQNKYSVGLQRFLGPITLSFDEVVKQGTLSTVQQNELQDYFSGASSWYEFFQSIPKEKQCTLLSWVPFFIDKLMGLRLNQQSWTIELGTGLPFEKNTMLITQTDLCSIERGPQTMIRTDMLLLVHSIPLSLLKRARHGGKRTRGRNRSTQTQKSRYGVTAFSNHTGGTILF
jgi:hypothetical protein